MRLNAIAGAVFEQIGQHIGHQPSRLGLLEQRRRLANRQGFGAQALQLEAEFLEPLRVFLGAISLALTHGDGFGHQQRLTTQAFAGHRGFQALVGDAFMGGMHVHQHHALGILRKDVDALELRQRIAQRRHIVLTGRQRRGAGFR
ncbi:hypothetical protein D3C77_495870 [compost metagenome]